MKNCFTKSEKRYKFVKYFHLITQRIDASERQSGTIKNKIFVSVLFD